MQAQVGEHVAVTPMDQLVMERLTGGLFQVEWRRARIIREVPLPAHAVAAARDAGVTDEELTRFHAFLVAPLDGYGNPVDSSMIDGDPEDAAFLAIQSPEQETHKGPAGSDLAGKDVHLLALAERVSKSEYLAQISAADDELVARFRDEIEEDL